MIIIHVFELDVHVHGNIYILKLILAFLNAAGLLRFFIISNLKYLLTLNGGSSYKHLDAQTQWRLAHLPYGMAWRVVVHKDKDVRIIARRG